MPLTTAGWVVAGVGCALLAAATGRWFVSPSIRVPLVILASAGITLAISGTFWSLVLLGASVILVTITWRLTSAPAGRSVSSAWIIALALIVAASRLPFAAPHVGPAVWIGISYLFLRLVHVCLDARQGRLGDVTLSQMLVYALHPATLVAGPIDRAQHSVAEQCRPPEAPECFLNEGFWRVFTGLIKKLILANAFYAITLSYDAIEGTPPIVGAWIWVFAYSFYIYFDFAAYSDLAVGVGLMMGMRLPENFANPYIQPSIAQFWQAWHITLSSWLRDYIFFPISRTLLKRYGSRFSPLIILTSHLVTMVASGLWHGFRLELVGWGVWHGMGLYVYNRWTIVRRRYHLPAIPTPIAIGVTYLFVSLGWLFFSMRFTHALRILARLFGLR